MDSSVEAMSQTCFTLEQGLAPNGVVPQLRTQITQWQDIVALTKGLQKPDMQERHWKKVAAALAAAKDADPGGGGVAEEDGEEVQGGFKMERDMPVEAVLACGMLEAKDKCVAHCAHQGVMCYVRQQPSGSFSRVCDT